MSTSNVCIYGELGQNALYISCFVRIIKYWCKATFSENCITIYIHKQDFVRQIWLFSRLSLSRKCKCKAISQIKKKRALVMFTLNDGTTHYVRQMSFII